MVYVERCPLIGVSLVYVERCPLIGVSLVYVERCPLIGVSLVYVERCPLIGGYLWRYFLLVMSKGFTVKQYSCELFMRSPGYYQTFSENDAH